MESVSTKLQRITEHAKRDKKFVFTNLMHLVDEVFLWEAYHRIRKDGAAGVDKVTGNSYAENLSENIRKLYERMKSGRYKVPHVKRVYIPKDDKSERPIGIACFEDKIVQKAVAMILGAIYEVDFYEDSHSFRPKRNQHVALQSLRKQCNEIEVTQIIDADIEGFFDKLNHQHMREILKKRVNDGSLLRLINLWMKAGIMDGKILSYPESGSPQGGTISPMLSNIYLHEVLDSWYVDVVKPMMRGKSFLVRFADDFLIGFEIEEDTSRVMKVLAKRFAKYGLTLHPKKTKVVNFKNPRDKGGSDSSDSFDFLGFTHYWDKTRYGEWVIKRRTSKKKLRAKMKSIDQWCRENMHERMETQWKTICRKLIGHYNYYGIRCNNKQMEAYYRHVRKCWRHWLNRRNTKNLKSWEQFDIILERYPLPKPKVMHAI